MAAGRQRPRLRRPRKLFGTDGVRGVAGEFVTAELALALARAATARAATRSTAARRRCSIIRDTRESGEMLEAAVAAGVTAAGGEALLGGILPTPGAPLLVRRHGFDLAVVLSASHNPYEDNGIKFFGGDGFKLSDADRAGDRGAAGGGARARPAGPASAASTTRSTATRRRCTRASAGSTCSGRRIALDCANGATFEAGAGDLPPPRRRRST